MKNKIVVTKLQPGKILDIRKLDDGSLEVTQSVEVSHGAKVILDDRFVLIEAEKLFMNDRFMKYKPRTVAEKATKELISDAITEGVENFYRPKYDPSFAWNGGIHFYSFETPAVGKSFVWWKYTAKSYDRLHHSRLGTKLQYGAFLGVLIKKLVEEGKSVEWAWNAVCNDSRKLGNYFDSEGEKKGMERTGSREVCGFCDLANTYKILADPNKKNSGFWLASGCFVRGGTRSPIANITYSRQIDVNVSHGVGWIVFPAYKLSN